MIRELFGSTQFLESQIGKRDDSLTDFADFIREAFSSENKSLNNDAMSRFISKEVSKHKKVRLVAYKDSYQSLSTIGLNLIPYWIKYWLDSIDIDDIDFVFFNPPKKVCNALSTLTNDIQIDVIRQKYANPSIAEVKESYQNFDKHIIGQGKIKTELFAALSNFSNNEKLPAKVIMLYGAPGVGKTETVKWLGSQSGEYLRIQMSMLQTISAHEYLYGKDHVEDSFGYDLISRNSNFVLLDEFDKVPDSFYNAFYQMFDESRFVDGNYNINLEGTYIFLTANYANKNDIIKNLGAPLYSRIDAFIQYDQLNTQDLLLFGLGATETLFEDLNIEYQSRLNLEKLKQEINNCSDLPNNPRAIKKFIQQKINECLIYELYEK